uniref:Uncharacterized protein n=1 Tax=Panagrolaimus superbus TaxID=310955 RepID=A0A914YE19_9BILA
MFGLSGVGNWTKDDFQKMNNVIVVHVDSECSASAPPPPHPPHPPATLSSQEQYDPSQQPGPSRIKPQIITSNNVMVTKSKPKFNQRDSMESIKLDANDTRLPPPPPPIDVRALQAAIFDEIDEDDQRPTSSASIPEGICYRQCTSYRLDPPLQNPVDLDVGFKIIAVADYNNGVHFVNFRGRVKKHFVSEPYRICGVRFREESGNDQVIMLTYLEQKWSIMVKTWPDMNTVQIIECPTEPLIMTWARRKITLLDKTIFLLATCDSCSAIWTLDLETFEWKTLVVERASPKKPISVTATLGNSFRRNKTTSDSKHAVYSDFDTKQWTDAERRVLLCQSEKSKLDILCINDKDKLTGSHTIKVKRKKNQQWIVKGPQLATFDSEQDIIVYDASGKIFWFDGSTYRIRKIIGDVGKSEVCAISVSNGWCYALCRHRLCIHAFMYKL